MTRLLATTYWDFTRQWRNGFYAASGFLLLVTAALIWPLPAGWVNWPLVLPAFLLGNLTVVAFYYTAALLLLEKAEGSLVSLFVSPLRGREYLMARLFTLTTLAVGESVLLVLICVGLAFRPWPLLAGLVLLSLLYTLIGFISCARYRAINDYFFPSILLVTLLTLPMADAVGLWHTPLFYLHPLRPGLLLLEGAFRPLTTAELLYAFLASLAWLATAAAVALQRWQELSAE